MAMPRKYRTNEERRAALRLKSRKKYEHSTAGLRVDPVDRPSAAAIAERDRLLSVPRSTTAQLCGDPLPGRSALDRKRQANPEISF